MASEKRLIDANELFNKVETRKYDNPHTAGNVRVNHAQEHTHFMKMILDATTVDAVEVVRCKDCRWSRPQDHREPTDTPEQTLICQCFKNHHIPAPWGARLAVNPDHFCAYGERKDDEREAD